MNIPRRKDWPGELDVDEMRKIPVELPRLSPDSPTTCPVPMSDILEHLSYEARGGENSGSDEKIEFQLEFVQTAQVEARQYWLWRFFDVEGVECYLLIELRDRETVTAYDESFGLTPEQFILGVHYDTLL
jgi:hypothetical protein